MRVFVGKLLWGQQGEPAYTQLSGGASINLDSNNFYICRADMDPNNVGIVRFARAGKFYLKTSHPRTQLQALPLGGLPWTTDPHSFLTRFFQNHPQFILRKQIPIGYE